MARLGSGMEGAWTGGHQCGLQIIKFTVEGKIKEFLSSEELHGGHLDISKFRQQQSREFKYCFLCI